MANHPVNEVRSYTDVDGRRYLRLPFPVPPPRTGLPVTWTTAPSLSGPGVSGGNVDAGTLVTCNPGMGTSDTALTPTAIGSIPGVTVSYAWRIDGQAVATGATYTPAADANLKSLTCEVTAVNAYTRAAVSNVLSIRDTSASAFPAALTASTLKVDEIRAPGDSNAGTGGRRRCKVSSVTIPAGFRLYWYSADRGGGGTEGSGLAQNTAAGTYEKTDGRAAGVVIYDNFLWFRESDSQYYPAGPSSGSTTAADWDVGVTPAKAARAFAAHPTVGTRGQLSMTIAGLSGGGETPFVWPQLTTAERAAATGQPLGGYRVTGSAGATGDLQDRLHGGPVGCAYASFAGDTAADARTLEWVAQLNASGNMPFGASAPSAAREAMFPAMWALIKRTPRLYDDPTKITAAQKDRTEIIIKALLICNAVRMADANTGRKTITGYANSTGVGGLPNLGTSPLLVMAACAGYMGLSAAAAFLESVNVATFKETLLDTLGTGSNIGVTWNWGATNQTVGSYYRMGPHADAMTPATIQSYIRGWRINAFPMTNLGRFLIPYLTAGENPGLNRVLSPSVWVKGSNAYNGLVWHSGRSTRPYFDTWSDYIVLGGTQAGLASAARAGMTHLGDTDCSYGELNGTDEGTRWATPYASWTRSAVHCALISLAVSGDLDPTDAFLGPWLHRWRKAENVYNYLDEHEHYPLAHMDPTTPPSGYNAGAGRPWGTDWRSYAAEYAPLATKALVHAMCRKWKAEPAGNWAFPGNVARWEASGSASIAYDGTEDAAKVTVSGSGGGIRNRIGDWSGSEPGSYNTTGHIEVKAGTTYDVVVTVKRGTYPAQPVVIGCSGSDATTAALTASYATYARTYTPGADGRLTVSVSGSANFTGDLFVKSISVKPR